jgi:Zn-dependent M28 family amino/carboxypeptidase
MEVAQAIASREWDHTVVAALWACEEEGLLGSAAFVDHLPEDKAVKAYLNFDMVSLNYPIIPPPGYGPYDLSIATAGAHDENLSVMLEWVRLVVEDEMNFHDVASNDIYWQAAESCASDHCSFFTSGYATFNFFSAGGDASFWQEWHSPTDTLDFMVGKAGGEDELGDGFNTLVWTAFCLFVHVDNTDDSFQGRWYTGEE